MSKFTAGKWKVGINEKYGSYVYASESDAIIAVIRSSGYTRQSDNPEEKEAVRQANARLIASAPEMYELMSRLVGEDSTVNTAEDLFDTYAEMKMLLTRIDGKETNNDE